MVISLLTFSYFTAVFWLIICDLSHHFMDQENQVFFIKEYNIRERTQTNQMLLVIYFIFTTLSSVGFGDMYPRNDIERVLCTLILVSGVIMFEWSID